MNVFVTIETELTTAFTDLLLGLIAFIAATAVLKTGASAGRSCRKAVVPDASGTGFNTLQQHLSQGQMREPLEYPPIDFTRRQRARIWSAAFGLLGVSGILGFVAHGIHMAPRFREALWHPLYLALGLTVALFVAGVMIDQRSKRIPLWLIGALLATGCGFYLVTRFYPDTFIVFILYEAVALVYALAGYTVLALRRREPRFRWMLGGIIVTMAAAAIQASERVSVTMVWEFDHNGVFHLVQIIGVLMLVKGLLPDRGSRESMDSTAAITASESDQGPDPAGR